MVTDQTCWECLEISRFPETFSDNSHKDKIQAVLRGIEVEEL